MELCKVLLLRVWSSTSHGDSLCVGYLKTEVQSHIQLMEDTLTSDSKNVQPPDPEQLPIIFFMNMGGEVGHVF